MPSSVEHAEPQQPPPHRGVLALQAGAVEAQGGDARRAPREMEEALVPALARLWLRQVASGQRDGLHHTHRHVDLGGGQDLWAVLRATRLRLKGWAPGVKRALPAAPTPVCAQSTHWSTEDLRKSQLGWRQEAWVLCPLGCGLSPVPPSALAEL